MLLLNLSRLNLTLVELKFVYSENATHFCEISTIDLSYIVTVKSEISQNFVAFSEYMNFKTYTVFLDFILGIN